MGGRGFPNPGSDDGFFDSPTDVAVARSGTVYVADCYNHRIQYFSNDMRFFEGKWGTEGERDRQFKYPRSVTITPDGSVYVAESSRVQYFSEGGAFLGKWGTQGSGDGQFNRARGTASSSSGLFYVADSVNNRVQYFK